MCFSAPVSFAASAMLLVIGTAAVRAARYPRQIPLATIPLLFGMQQGAEGVLWLILPEHPVGPWAFALVQLFVGFVGVLWPLLMPAACLCLEKKPVRQLFISAIMALGGLIAVYTVIIMVVYGFKADVSQRCLVYTNPAGVWPGMVAIYVTAVCGAFFVSSDRMLRKIGMVNLVGFAVAAGFYNLNFPSVWCFFAALISSFIWLKLHIENQCIGQTVVL
ncbi:MAG TPA: DUF6629 family protein [Asticcacaulis sp.]|nr:DUF6629 family protein [Asticcacaulis sp.]